MEMNVVLILRNVIKIGENVAIIYSVDHGDDLEVVRKTIRAIYNKDYIR